MGSRVRTKWLIGCLFVSLGAFGCTVEASMPNNFNEVCKDGLMICICAGGESTGYIPCNADRVTTECGGCAPPRAGSVAGSASSPAAVGVAGAASRSAAGSGATVAGPSTGSASAPATLPPGAACSVGEVCRVTVQGSMKFCSRDPAATVPPVCTVPGQPCGSNNLGTCSSGAPAGVPTALYCVYPSC